MFSTRVPRYPGRRSDGHSIGFTDIDDRGQEALELAFETSLTGKAGTRRVIKDRRGHIIEDIESIRQPQHGAKLTLSVDTRIQHIAFRELKNAVANHRAKAGGIVVLDARTGEVLAMANLPSYNPNNRGKLDPRRMRNRAVTDLFEPGSTLKPFTAAVALETGKVRPETIIQTAPGHMTIGNRTITPRTHGAPVTPSFRSRQSARPIGAVAAAETLLSLSGRWFRTQPPSCFP